MARFGRSFAQKSRILGIPPTEAPGYAAPTDPVANGISVTSGGRHGRQSPTRPLTRYAPRPQFSAVFYIDTGSGTITFAGTGSDSLAFADSGAGSATLSGSGSGSHALTDSATGNSTLAGTSSDALAFTDSRTGSNTLAGSSSDALGFSDAGSGTESASGTSSDALSYTDGASGATSLTGSAVGSVSYTDSAAGNWGLSGARADALSFTDSKTGANTLAGSGVESIAITIPRWIEGTTDPGGFQEWLTALLAASAAGTGASRPDGETHSHGSDGPRHSTSSGDGQTRLSGTR